MGVVVVRVWFWILHILDPVQGMGSDCESVVGLDGYSHRG
jgi:hypothetical protein